MLHVTSQFLYVGNIVPEEEVVGVLVPAEVVQPDDGEVADEAQEAGAGPRLAGRGRAEAGGRSTCNGRHPPPPPRGQLQVPRPAPLAAALTGLLAGACVGSDWVS